MSGTGIPQSILAVPVGEGVDVVNTVAGTTGQVLVNGGTTAASGAVVLTLANPLTLPSTLIGTAQTAGLTLANTTLAAAGAQQFSPMSVLQGAGWGTTAPGSQTVAFGLQVQPSQGATAPGGWALCRSLSSAGVSARGWALF